MEILGLIITLMLQLNNLELVEPGYQISIHKFVTKGECQKQKVFKDAVCLKTNDNRWVLAVNKNTTYKER